MRKRNWLFAGLVLCLCTVGTASGGVMYTITSLGSGYDEPSAINDLGQVTGFVNDASQQAYLYTPTSGIQTLGILPGGYASTGLGLNDSGAVVGVSFNKDGSYGAFLYNNGTMQGLGTLGGNESVASGINSAGVVVGRANDASETPHAFMYVGNVMHDLGQGGANAINSAGQIVGFNGAGHAALFTDGSSVDLGTLPGDSASNAVAINQNGQIVGYSYTSGGPLHGFIDDDGTMHDLGNLGGQGTEATGINDLGQVVGGSTTASDASDAFIYSNGVMTDLNTLIDPDSGWQLTEAEGINDLGQITGTGDLDGHEQAFVLTPTTPVPEPATLSLVLVELPLILRRRRLV